MINSEQTPIPKPENKKTEGFVEVFGSQIHYERRGVGQPVILIDGWLGSTKAFDRVIGDLAKDHECIALDYPGFGVSSEFLDRRHTLRNFSDSILGAMDKLGVEKAGIIGDSLGTMVALEMATNSPEKVEYLVLQGAPIFPEKAKRIISKMDRNIVGKLASDAFRSPFMEVFRWANPEFKGMSVRERESAAGRLKKTSGKAAIESLKDMVAFDLAEAASKVDVPVLVVEGEHTAKTPFSGGAILRRSVRSDLFSEAIVPKGTHTVMLKKPCEFVEEVINFRNKLEVNQIILKKGSVG